MQKRIQQPALLVLMVLTLVGCSGQASRPSEGGAPVDDRDADSAAQSQRPAGSAGATLGGGGEGRVIGGGEGAISSGYGAGGAVTAVPTTPGRDGVESIPFQPAGGRADGSPLNDPNNPLAQRVFYFGYDNTDLSQTDYETLVAHARYLIDNPQLEVIVEGHTDERGSREYNLALAERRAMTVERFMLLQGVAAKQLQVISFGEERPVALGHDDQAWQLNRRVELLYSGI